MHVRACVCFCCLRLGGVRKDTRTRAEVAIIYGRATENGHKFINYPARVCARVRVYVLLLVPQAVSVSTSLARNMQFNRRRLKLCYVIMFAGFNGPCN